MSAIKTILLSLLALAFIAILLIAFNLISFADPSSSDVCPVADLPDKHDICHIPKEVRYHKVDKILEDIMVSRPHERVRYDTNETGKGSVTIETRLE